MTPNPFIGFKVTLLIEKRQEIHLIASESFGVGRDYTSDLMVYNKGVSRNHLKISWVKGEIFVMDCGSSNGTMINGEKLPPNQEYVLPEKACIQVGKDNCEIYIETLKPLWAMADSQSDVKGSAALTQSLWGSKKIPPKVKAEAENLIINGSKVKQIILKEALTQAEQKLHKARAEAAGLIDLAKQDADMYLSEGRRLADEFKENAQESAQLKLDEAERRAEKLLKEAETRLEETSHHISSKKSEFKEWLQNSNSKKEELQSQLQKLDGATKRSQEFAQAAKIEAEQIELELSRLEENITDLRDESGRLESAAAECKKQLASDEARINAIQEEEKSKESRITALKSQYAELENKIIKLTEQQDELNLENASLLERKNSNQQEALACEQKLTEAQNHLYEKEKELADYIESHKLRKRSIKNDLNKLEETYDHKISKLRAEQDRVEGMAERAHAHFATRAHKTARQIAKRSILSHRRILKKAYVQGQKLIAEAQEQAQTLAEKNLKQLEKLGGEKIRLSAEKAEENHQRALSLASELVKKAKRESAELLKQTEIDARERAYELEQEQKKSLALQRSELEVEIDQLKENVRSLKSKEEKKLISEIEKQKQQAVKELEQQLEERKKGADEERNHYLHQLSQELSLALQTRLSPFLNQEKVEHLEVNLSDEMRDVVQSVLFPDELNSNARTKIYGENPLDRQKKIRRFWIKTASASVTALALLILVPVLRPYFESRAKDFVENSESSSENYVNSVTDSWSKKPKFEPEKVDEYKLTYSDRVLYTKDYAQHELDGAYREKWIVDLNEYVIDELRLSENAIIPFVSKEANLIRDLSKKLDQINPAFADEGILRLRELEKEFVTEVKGLLKTETNFEKVNAFKKEHYMNYFTSERGLAESLEE